MRGSKVLGNKVQLGKQRSQHRLRTEAEGVPTAQSPPGGPLGLKAEFLGVRE